MYALPLEKRDRLEMSMKIRIRTESAGDIPAEIVTDKNPRTAEAIWEALPIKGTANRWGEEIYFDVSVKVPEENSQEVVEIGDLAYWPSGSCFCIFFGATPASKGKQPQAASPVNVFGRVIMDATNLTKVKRGEEIEVERTDQAGSRKQNRA
jgi:uncharacterized protein